jgi:hypothetical protein
MIYALVALVAYVVGRTTGKAVGWNSLCRKLESDRDYRKMWERRWRGEVW